MPKKKGDSASPLFKIGWFLCYQKKVVNSAVTYFIGNTVSIVAYVNNLKVSPLCTYVGSRNLGKREKFWKPLFPEDFRICYNIYLR